MFISLERYCIIMGPGSNCSRCPKDEHGVHDFEEERMYGFDSNGKSHHGVKLTCKNCGHTEFKAIY